MHEDLASKIEKLTVELTNVLGVVGTKEESNVSEKVFKTLREMKYFKKHPELVKYVPVKNDKLGRKSVLAIVKGEKGNSKKAVICIGHTDTVGISDYGNLKDYATKPYELLDKLKEVSLPAEALKDLQSGEYLFGRGIFDMKCGDATLMSIMESISDNVEEFEGNLLYAGVCDEEGNSGGMLSVVPELIRLKEEEGFDYTAVLDTDYMAPRYVGDNTRYVYVGTVGKLMPTFYIVGKETHVGEPYKGLDPNQIAGAITNKINLNVKYCDIAEGEVSLPPITLRQQDLKEEYSVQIAKTAYLYFNFSTHKSTPDEVINMMAKGAQEAFQDVIDDLNVQYKEYCKMSDFPYEVLPWKARVMTYDELYRKVKEEKGEAVDNLIKKLSDEMIDDPKIDERAFGLRIVQEVHKMWSDKDPVVIAYFSAPYYPHIYVEGKREKEEKLLNAVKDAANALDTKYDIVVKKFYPYISDLSYASAPKEDKVIDALKDNMPGYGTKYDLPLKEMQQLDLPVVNIGPFGKDAHKFTERLEKEYSFSVAPQIVYNTILNLLK